MSSTIYCAQEPAANSAVKQIREAEYTALDSIMTGKTGEFPRLSDITLFNWLSMLHILYAIRAFGRLLSGNEVYRTHILTGECEIGGQREEKER